MNELNKPSVDEVLHSIVILRGQKVLLDADLARMYGVELRVLIQSVKRNANRFPNDFMLQLTAPEWNSLRSQFVILKTGRGRHRKYLPYAFTEQGVAMLSSVINSERAIAVNIEVMRAFVRMRNLLASNTALARRLNQLEAEVNRKLATHDQAITGILKAIRELMNPLARTGRPIGFTANIDEK